MVILQCFLMSPPAGLHFVVCRIRAIATLLLNAGGVAFAMGSHQVVRAINNSGDVVWECNKHQHGWEKEESIKTPKSTQIKNAARAGGRAGAVEGADLLWRKTKLHVETSTGSRVATAETEAKLEGFEHMNAKAGAGAAYTSAAASANPTQAKASAGVCGPNAGASAALVAGIVEATSEAYVG